MRVPWLDVRNYIHSLKVSKNVYGVILDEKTKEIDWEETEKKREEIRKERLKRGKMGGSS